MSHVSLPVTRPVCSTASPDWSAPADAGVVGKTGLVPWSLPDSQTSSAELSAKSSSIVYASSTRLRFVTSSGSPGASSCTVGAWSISASIERGVASTEREPAGDVISNR